MRDFYKVTELKKVMAGETVPAVLKPANPSNYIHDDEFVVKAPMHHKIRLTKETKDQGKSLHANHIIFRYHTIRPEFFFLLKDQSETY